MKKLPKTIRVGGIDYKIIQRAFKNEGAFDDTANYHGYCDRTASEIHLNTESPLDGPNTLIHEILHALFREYNLPTHDEEDIVIGLANGLSATFKNNPKLLDTIKENL